LTAGGAPPYNAADCHGRLRASEEDAMSHPDVLTIHTDGASRGNPGAAAFAYTITRDGQPPVEEAGCLGTLTNNQAEYTALVRALEHALRLGPHHPVVIHSDSELMVKQMRGEYRVKDPGLRSLYEAAAALSERFEHRPRFVHVRREHNSRADALCNQALDGQEPSRPSPAPGNAAPALQDPVKEKALACLRTVAAAWARGNPNDPSPEMVWNQLWSILEEEGALRRPRPKR
jgi:ribonuclease HI